MKAKVRATGEIVDVCFSPTNCVEVGSSPRCWKVKDLDFDLTEEEYTTSITPVYCPHCGNLAKMIWSGGNNGKWVPSWHCHCTGWFTTDPTPFHEKPQQFKNLFDL